MWPCWLHGGYQIGKFELIGGHIFVRFFGSCNENLPESQVFTAVATNGEWRMSLLRFGENSRKGLKMESFQEIDMVGSGKTMILL